MAEINGIGMGSVPLPLAVPTAPAPAPPHPAPVSPVPGDSPNSPAQVPHQAQSQPGPGPVKKPDLKSFTEIVKPISVEEMSKFLRKLNMSTNLFAIQSDISFDKRINWYRVVIRNTETGQVIREIPPWDIGNIAEYIKDRAGKLLDIVV